MNLPPWVSITFQIIISLVMTAIGVDSLIHRASPLFMVPWLALVLVITVMNVRKLARRRQAPQIMRDHTNNRGSSHRHP